MFLPILYFLTFLVLFLMFSFIALTFGIAYFMLKKGRVNTMEEGVVQVSNAIKSFLHTFDTVRNTAPSQQPWFLPPLNDYLIIGFEPYIRRYFADAVFDNVELGQNILRVFYSVGESQNKRLRLLEKEFRNYISEIYGISPTYDFPIHMDYRAGMLIFTYGLNQEGETKVRQRNFMESERRKERARHAKVNDRV